MDIIIISASETFSFVIYDREGNVQKIQKYLNESEDNFNLKTFTKWMISKNIIAAACIKENSRGLMSNLCNKVNELYFNHEMKKHQLFLRN